MQKRTSKFDGVAMSYLIRNSGDIVNAMRGGLRRFVVNGSNALPYQLNLRYLIVIVLIPNSSGYKIKINSYLRQILTQPTLQLAFSAHLPSFRITIASTTSNRLSHLLRTMSTITTHSSSSPGTTAPWKPLFLNHLSKLPSPEFVLSSLHPAPPGSPTPYLPRVRYCIFRGMWAELPENKHNETPTNERVYETELPTFTSDVRMEKIPEIFASSAGHGERAQSRGSGGGGPVEAAFWIKEVMTQWRIKGEAFVVGDDIEGEGEESSGVRTVKSEVGSRMRVVQEGKEKGWSWAKEYSAQFGNLSPGMRG